MSYLNNLEPFVRLSIAYMCVRAFLKMKIYQKDLIHWVGDFPITRDVRDFRSGPLLPKQRMFIG